jgi:hypothetical protein
MFGYVFLRAFQQKNTGHSKYLWMLPTSYGMAYCDVYVGGAIVSVFLGQMDRNIAVLTMGTAGWMSCMLATYLHNRWNI